MPEKKILYSDDASATYKTDIRGWVSANGIFLGDNAESEHLARWNGCTHLLCKKCGKEMRGKTYTACERCRAITQSEKWSKKELIEWDRKTPLYSLSYDQYFFDEEAILEFLYDVKCPIDENVLLVICAPIYPQQLDEDYWTDDLAEDGEVSNEMREAIEKLNEVVLKQEPLSFTPSSQRVLVQDIFGDGIF